jgi:hypothetical protein
MDGTWKTTQPFDPSPVRPSHRSIDLTMRAVCALAAGSTLLAALLF